MSRIIIFEGPDGAGKTTLAMKCARDLGAQYIHFGPTNQIKKALGRLYVEAALPALLGYQDVVFDRSWLSELPYGMAFRGGVDRLGPESRRMLERIFMRCETSVVLCNPGWHELERNFRKGTKEEMLHDTAQLAVVHGLYLEQRTSLPCVTWNYLIHADPVWSNLPMTKDHETAETAGNIDARTLIIGESYAALTDADSFYQKPFCSFSGAGCSRWLTRELEIAGISEDQLLWVNADHLTDTVDQIGADFRKILALGVPAASEARAVFGDHVIELEHPQSHKRFKFNSPYPIREALR